MPQPRLLVSFVVFVCLCSVFMLSVSLACCFSCAFFIVESVTQRLGFLFVFLQRCCLFGDSDEIISNLDWYTKMTILYFLEI